MDSISVILASVLVSHVVGFFETEENSLNLGMVLLVCLVFVEARESNKCKLMRPKEPRVGDKGETSVNTCGPRNPEWETSVRDKCGRQV